MGPESVVLVETLQAAYAAAREGRFDAAEALCARILAQDPEHAGALLLRGMIETESGRSAEGARSLQRSIARDPERPIAHVLLGDALMNLGNPRAALMAYETALRLDADAMSAHFGRGNALLDLREPEAAIASFDTVLRRRPEDAEAWFNRGNAMLALERWREAIASFDCALRRRPDYVAAHCNRGSALLSLYCLDDALRAFDAALAIDPTDVPALNNRAAVLRELRRYPEALAGFERALALRPDHADAHLGRGNTLLELDRPSEAFQAYERAIRSAPANPEPRIALGNAWRSREHYPAAIACYDAALALAPDSATAYFNRAQTRLRWNREIDQALDDHARALALKPRFDYWPGSLLHAQRRHGDWSVRQPSSHPDAIARAVAAGARADMPFSFLAVSDSAEAQLRCARSYVDYLGVAAPAPRNGRRSRGTRLKVGYFSADLRQHAVSYLMAGVFERHDVERFEILGMSLRPAESTPLGRRVRAAFSRFVDLSGLDDGEAAAAIRALEVDVLVDLTGYTEGCRPRILALRPAPIQVNFLGFPATTGGAFIDYLIADAHVIPPESRRHYRESVVTLPDCFQPTDDARPRDLGAFSRGDVGLPDDAFVFCCFNNTYKINPKMYDLWMRLLHAVPGSVLWLLAVGDALRDRLRREAQTRGIDPKRIVFAGRRPYADYLRQFRLADLFLDTLPFNAGTTASDALWGGLPLLTCSGDAFAARMAGSVLRAAGLRELVTETLADYEALAIRLATHPHELGRLRDHLVRRRQALPLFDTRRFCRHLEAAYEEMWSRQARGEEPSDFAVAKIANDRVGDDPAAGS
jgi:predicted O-linked N-acetylglucosamine transferase (SPINDLY family)